MKTILGLDLGTNSIGWALVKHNFEDKKGEIIGTGSRILPMSQDLIGKFDSGVSISQTAERTNYRSTRKLYQRDNLRRERLHRVLNILDFLPKHYADSIDFKNKLGQFKEDIEIKLNYKNEESNKYKFLFTDSFNEMISDFKQQQPELFYTKNDGHETKIPYDWTIYFLRTKALRDKITKEELAWIILNFNQKRGYYQLRGEETADDNKDKQYVQLEVKELIDSGEKIKDKTLYDVYFTNGWKYSKQVVKKEDWIGKTKEFIVTISTLKNGEKKYSYKAVDSEKDWLAIKSKTEQDISISNKTVGQYIYETLLTNPTQKIRGKLIKTIERKFYKEELHKIISKQIELQPELFNKELYQKCIEELYPRNEAHQNSLKDKGFEHLLINDIIFYQRPLKSQKSNISTCQFEYRYYNMLNKETGKNETIKKPINAIPKSHPLFQEFRIWQWLKNLRIYNINKITKGKFEDATPYLLENEEDWTKLFIFLNTKQQIEQHNIIDYFVNLKKIEKQEKHNFRWNYVEDKKYPLAETINQFISRFKKIENINNIENFLSEKTAIGKERNKNYSSRAEQLWHIIYSINDLKEYEKALKKFANKYQLSEGTFVESFIKFPPFKSDYSSYSKKAIEKLLPLMRIGEFWKEDAIHNETIDRINKLINGEYDEKIRNQVREKTVHLNSINDFKGLPLWLASYVVYNRHAETNEIQQWNNSHDIQNYLYDFKQHQLRNPIVELVIKETLRVVKDIWEYYAEANNISYEMIYDKHKKKEIKSYSKLFDEIHLELGREMKNPKDKRIKMTNKNIENENTNYRIKEILKELMNDSSVEGNLKSYSPSQQELLKIYEEGIYKNPDTKYTSVSEDEIEKIRRNSNPTKKEIQKYRLWLEQGYISPYTGNTIPLTKLFTTAYEIEHIIPQSRYFDNSLSNKVICETSVNQDKGNKTAYEYIKNKNGSIIDGHKLFTLDKYENHINKYFKNNKPKLKNLLSEEIPEDFINRQLNDSRYISKFIKGVLSNLVREKNENEAIAINLIPVTGAVTSKLKHDWGLNDKWNEIIAPRFKRLNEITQSNKFGFWDTEINAFRIQVPDDISKGFNAKRIDHRHHALDALVIALTTKDHTNYLSALNAENKNYSLRDKLLIKNKQNDYTKHFLSPWNNFTTDAKNALENVIISFKQNTRIINKTNNKFWSYKSEQGNLNIGNDGKPKKKLRKQTKGDNWAIRKSLHKETVSGIYNIATPKGKIATAVRTPLTEIKNEKHLAKITDQRIREVILPNHLNNYLDENGEPQYDLAFSQEGIDALNNNIYILNNNKKHQPIYKVKLFEVGSKFPVSDNINSTKNKKFVEAAQGTNLFFAVYWNPKKEKRNFETIPLNEVIAHQKQVAHLPSNQRTPIQVNNTLGNFLFTLTPNDLVYVPTEDELNNPNLVDFNHLTKEQTNRIYKMVSCTGYQSFFIEHHVSKSIQSKFEFSTLNKMEKSIDNIMIKEVCWKLIIDKLGNITSVVR